MKVIAITGGPCGGKTTIINAIRERFGRDNGVRVINEAATALLTVFPIPGQDVKLTQEWMCNFQPVVKMVQERSLLAWRQSNAEVLVSDRGMADGPAYLGNQEEFCKLLTCTMEDLWLPYDEVIYLPSLATIDPDLFLKERASNPCRYETLEEAQALDMRLQDAWEGCHQQATWTYLQGDLEEKKRFVLEVIRQNLEGDLPWSKTINKR